ncbi:hypothetical protein JCM10212_005645 [Sporobolomyces blumeae]
MVRSPPLITLFALACVVILLPTYVVLRPSFDSPEVHNARWAPGSVARGGPVGAHQVLAAADADELDDSVKFGQVIMPKLGNATAKAELGRASWKLLHTMAARFPEKPSKSEREAFKSFLYLFSRLYPCGECAAEFQELLRKSPPQTSSRSAASMHLCHLHNQVNLRLGKPEFDCSKDLEGIYDCGCGGDEVSEDETKRHEVGAGQTLERQNEKVDDEASEAGRIPLKHGGPSDDEEDDAVRRDPETGLEMVGG